MTVSRFALYFAPHPGTTWHRFGDSALSGEARRYGFHATLKAPFRLAAGARLEELVGHLEQLCGSIAAFDLPPLRVAWLDHFSALVPARADPRIDELAALCVREFERFRAPLTEEELERRRSVPLSSRQQTLLERWGYPFVLDEFRFHLSLTGRLAGRRFPPLPQMPTEPLAFDSICVFEEPAAGSRFRLAHRAQLAAQGRLLYVVGPSGAGKDSVLRWAQESLGPGAPVHFAQRAITRPRTNGDEAHRSLTREAFEAELAAGHFAMHWRANGCSYGVGNEIRQALARGLTVVVNGSRAHLPQAIADFPQLEVVHLVASEETLRRRLAARGRETAAQAMQRLARNAVLAIPGSVRCTEIRNESAIEVAGNAFLERLELRP